MMKIGFFTARYLPVTYGIEVSTENFRKKLEDLGHEVFIFAPYYSGYIDKNPRVFRFRSLRFSENREIYFSFPPFPKNSQLKKVLNIKLDIAHAHSPFNMGLFAKYVSFHQKIPLVYTHHIRYANIWSAWFSNLSNLAIAPSLKVERILRKCGAKKKIVIFPTGVNIKRFRKIIENKEILKKKLNIPPQTKILLFAGRIEVAKNLTFLIKSLCEVLKERKDIVLLIVGSGSFLEKLKEGVRKLGIEKFVKFTGRIPHQEIPFYYQGSDIFVFPSLSETQGLVILEAEAVGLPVVVLKDDAFLDIVKDKENGFFVKEKNPKIFAKYILKILKDPQLYQKFSLASQKIAKSLSEEKQAKKLLEIYGSLLK